MGGNKFAISCRGTDYGCVYYIDHEETNPDEFSVRLTASARIMPTFFAKGVVRLATKFSDFIRQLHFTREDWVKHLLNTDFVHFQAFVEDAGLDYTDDIGTPLINLVASYGTLRDLEWLYRKGARAEKIVCHAVRNTREPVPMIRFLLDSGEDGAAFFKEGLPYPMGYAKRNNLRDIVAVLREYNVADSPSL